MLAQVLTKVVVAVSVFNLLLTTYIYCSRYKQGAAYRSNKAEVTQVDAFREFEVAWHRAEISSRTRDFFVDSDLLRRKGPNVPLRTYRKPSPEKERNPSVFGWVGAWRDQEVESEELGRVTRASDVYFSVRTTESNHETRIPILLKTWISLVPSSTRILTDAEDFSLLADLKARFGQNAPALIVTDCPSRSHSKWALFCKLYWEFQHYVLSGLRESWFCHFDDDAYVNVHHLLSLLSNFDPGQPVYLGRAPSKTRATVTIAYKVDLPGDPFSEEFQNEITDEADIVSFHFALGGAGFCVSRELANRMIPLMEGSSIVRVAASISLPDDCVMGYVITHFLNVSLTNVPQMHSHIEDMTSYTLDDLTKEVTFSFNLLDHEQTGRGKAGTGYSAVGGTEVLRLHSAMYGREGS